MAKELQEIKRPTDIEGVIFLLYKNGKYLVVENQKPGSGFFGHVIFPGGKIEKGETPEEAVVREVREELGVNASGIIYLDSFEDVTLNLGYHRFHAYLVLNFDGELINKEPQKGNIQWVSLGEAREALKLVSSRHPLNLAERYIGGM